MSNLPRDDDAASRRPHWGPLATRHSRHCRRTTSTATLEIHLVRDFGVSLAPGLVGHFDTVGSASRLATPIDSEHGNRPDDQLFQSSRSRPEDCRRPEHRDAHLDVICGDIGPAECLTMGAAGVLAPRNITSIIEPFDRRRERLLVAALMVPQPDPKEIASGLDVGRQDHLSSLRYESHNLGIVPQHLDL